MSAAPLRHELFKRAVYPAKNRVIWDECARIMESPVVLIGQMNNLSTPKAADLRHRLRQENLFLRFPKPGILRAYLRDSKWHDLEPAVVGPTFCAVSRSQPSELKQVISMLTAEKNIILLGGKIVDYQFTIEGMQELIMSTPSLSEMQCQLLGLLQSAGLGLTQSLQSASMALAGTLDTHRKVLEEGRVDT